MKSSWPVDRLSMLFRNRPGRIWLRIAMGAAAVGVVALVGAFVALSLVDWSKYSDLAVTEVKKATGRDLRIAGKIDVGLLPLRLIVDGVSLSNAPWGSRPQMVTAKRVEIRAALLPLLVGKVRLKINVTEPDLFLETDAKGVGNWVVARAGNKQESDARSDSAGPPVGFDAARMTGGVVQYRSGRTGKIRRLSFEEAYIRPKVGSGMEINVKASLDGVPVSISAATDSLLVETLTGGESLGIEIEAKIGSGASLAASGRIGFPATGARLALKVRAEVAETGELAKLAGERFPHFPPIKLEGEIKSDKRIHAFEDVKLSMGKSAASGSARIDLSGARPKVSADLVAPLIDLLGLREPAAQGRAATNRASGRVFSEDPLPFAQLNAFDAEANLKVDRLALPPGLLFEAVHGRIVLTRGKLETSSFGMRMGGGDVKFAGSLDASGAKDARVSATMTGNDIELGKMMAALGERDAITGGPTELKLELRSVGASSAALAAALDGHVRMVAGPARTRNRLLDRAGINIVAQVLNAVNPTRKTEQYTQIECAVINVPVRKGVVTVDRTVAVETDQVGIAMAGKVNLATETLDLSIRPQAKRGIGVGGLANLVKVQGTLADPSVGVDIAGAAGTAAQIGLGVMTGGLSLLAKGLFDQATMEAPCETALRSGRAPEGGRRPSGGDNAEQPAAGGGIGGFFERLFK